MGTGTAIEWAHHTYNPWFGCTRISPACDHCYAAEWDKRYHGGEHWGAGAPRKRTSVQTRNAPYRWARHARETGERPRVFCCSLADVFDNEVPAEWRDELWQVIRDTPELDWLLLTKRIGNVRSMLPDDWGEGWPHVWLGITVVTQAEAERDIPKLLGTPAAVRWLSMEPLLGPIGIEQFLRRGDDDLRSVDPLAATLLADAADSGNAWVRPALDWVVAGGESGPGARPLHPAWVRSLRDQCAEANVPFFFKQWGEWAPGECAGAIERTERTADLFDGEWSFGLIRPSELDGMHWEDEPDVYRVGKKTAGRLLDGVTHDGFPDPAAAHAEAERSHAAEDSR